VTVRSTGRPGLHIAYCTCFQSIQARQSCGAWATGEPTTGGGEVGRGGEDHLPRTDEIKGVGDAGREREATEAARLLSNFASACTIYLGIRGGGTSVTDEEALSYTEVEPESAPSASEEGPGRTSALSVGFPAPALDAGVLTPPRGVFPGTTVGGFGLDGRGASTAMSTGWGPPSFFLHCLFGFTTLRALKNPGEWPGPLRTESTKVNITSLILAIGRALVGGTSLMAERTRCVWPLGMNSTQVMGDEGVLR
jgi:hypothetical protein